MRAYKPGEISREPLLSDQGVRRIEVHESLERLGWLMDDLIRIPVVGWRIGLMRS